MPNCLAIGNAASLLDSQAQRKNLARNKRSVPVFIRATRIEDRRANVERPTPNVELRYLNPSKRQTQAVCSLMFSVRCWAFGVFYRNQAAVLSCFLRISGS